LAFCSKIVERHGGDLKVENTTGEGSTFSFTLQAAENGGENEDV
jgi:signal transduction histidine kinase